MREREQRPPRLSRFAVPGYALGIWSWQLIAGYHAVHIGSDGLVMLRVDDWCR